MIGQLVIQVVITSLQYVAGGAILSAAAARTASLRCAAVSIRAWLITAVVFVGITLIGGFWAAGLTNVINVIVIYVGRPARRRADGEPAGRPRGLARAAARRPIPGFDLLAVGPGADRRLVHRHDHPGPLDPGGDPDRLRGSKDERHAARGYLLGGLLILPVGFISAMIGMAAAVLHPGIVPAEALPAGGAGPAARWPPG